MITGISFGCGGYCQIEGTADTGQAFEIAVERYGWSRRDGRHYCSPCTRAESEMP